MRKIVERETPAQNIAFLGILSGVAIVITLICSFVPFLSLLGIFIMSATSALGSRLTKIRYSLPFIFATSILMLGVSFFNLQETIFYLIPSLLTGWLYGVLIRLKTPTSYLIWAVGALTMGLNYLSLPIIKLIYGLDYIETTINILHLSSYPNVYTSFPALLLSLGIGQATLSHFIIVLLHGHLNMEESGLSPLLDGVASIFFGVIAFLPGYWCLELAYIALISAFYFSVLLLYQIILKKKKLLWILSGVIIILGIFFIAFLTPLLTKERAILLGAFYPITLGILLILFSIKKNESVGQ